MCDVTKEKNEPLCLKLKQKLNTALWGTVGGVGDHYPSLLSRCTMSPYKASSSTAVTPLPAYIPEISEGLSFGRDNL